MACNCNNKKSAVQKYNFTAQELTATPSPMSMGATAGLPSGPSLVDRGNNIGVRHTGLYRLSAQLIAAITTAGTLHVQAYYNGVPIAATLKTMPVAVGSVEISIDNLLYLVVPQGCACADLVYPIDVYAWVTDAAVGNISSMTVNALREA